MNFHQHGGRDNAWFVIALLIPALFFSVRFVDSERQLDRIASAAHQAAPVVIAQARPEAKR